MIRLLSVPHTGTRFVVELLQNAGLKRTHAFWGDGDFMQVHFDGARNRPLIYREGGPVIISMRGKNEVIESWRRRGKSLPDMERSWEEMEDFIQDHDDVFQLHVDDPLMRDNELAAIAERIGVELVADFSLKVGQGK